VGANHAGFKAKEALKKYLDKNKIKYVDHGPDKIKPKDDYPDYAHHVAKLISIKPSDRAIMICGSGFGMAIASNRHKRVRAVVAHSIKEAKVARTDDDINILCLSSRLQAQRKHRSIVKTFLSTRFAGGRHARRVKKIDK